MGAQTPDRLKQFNKRYQDWDDPQGEYTPLYQYILDSLKMDSKK